jgi:Family of unknown function (DUF5681)
MVLYEEAAVPGASKRRGRPFVKGLSGNPKGRILGSRNKTSELCAELLGADAKKIMRQCIKQAKQGEGIALRLCIERLLPARASRDRSVQLDLPMITAANDLVEAASVVIGATARGELTMSEANEFMRLLEFKRKAIETTDLIVRLEAMELAGAKLAMGGVAAFESPDVAARVRRVLAGAEVITREDD